MKCNQSYKYFQSGFYDAEFSEHLKSCEACSELFGRINQTLAILDEKVEIPSGLTEKVLQIIEPLKLKALMSPVDLTKYLQLAAVVAVGIFLGVFLGSRANPKIFLSKKDKKEKALIEYRESHHLNDQSTIYRF
jgi:hypothetical protein